jgi:predicted dehydrogenase
VLCEKPFAVNLRESEEMFAAARRHGRVLMEAFMYRTHPLIKEVQRVIRSGAIGTVRQVRTSFCYRTRMTDGNIRFDPTLAGGALMDVGCYCLNFSRLFAGCEPSGVQVVGRVHERGVDEHAAGVLTFPNGVLATFACAMTVQADNTATISGDEGYVEIPIPWKPPAEDAVYVIARATPPRQDLRQGGSTAVAGSPREVRHVSTGGVGLYGVEADDFAGSVLDGAALAVSSEDTLGNMRLLDESRRQIGLKF